MEVPGGGQWVSRMQNPGSSVVSFCPFGFQGSPVKPEYLEKGYPFVKELLGNLGS